MPRRESTPDGLPAGRARRLIRSTLRAVAAAALLTTTVQTISLAAYVARSEEGVLQAGATWARDRGLGPVVDRLEVAMYSRPPSSSPATALASALDHPVPATSTTHPAPSPSTTLPAGAYPPIRPVQPRPLPNEGVWRPALVVDGRPVVAVTSLRPSLRYGSVLATYARFDPASLQAVLYGGSETPGGRGWRNYARVGAAERPSLLFTFNGGFRFEHLKGGYKAEGRVVKPLRDGDASIAVDRSGRIFLGVLGRDLQDSPEWVSIRQNLTPLVDGGVSRVTPANRNRWGANYGGVTYVPRSALCTLADGSMVWALVGDIDAAGLAEAMVLAGCTLAVQLDINGTWPHFAVYDGHGSRKRSPSLIDRRMENPGRYLNGSGKDFYAFFTPQPAEIPDPSPGISAER